jgi:hypothetical protein
MAPLGKITKIGCIFVASIGIAASVFVKQWQGVVSIKMYPFQQFRYIIKVETLKLFP